MTKRVEGTLNIEGVKIIFRNFSGKEGKFNPAGVRNLGILLSPEHGESLEKEGWNIKWLKPIEEGDDPQPYMQVAVTYANFPPKVVLITKTGKTLLDEDSISLLDWADIVSADIVITPYNWEVNGKGGVKAYLKALYVTIEEDEFANKYSDLPIK